MDLDECVQRVRRLEQCELTRRRRVRHLPALVVLIGFIAWSPHFYDGTWLGATLGTAMAVAVVFVWWLGVSRSSEEERKFADPRYEP